MVIFYIEIEKLTHLTSLHSIGQLSSGLEESVITLNDASLNVHQVFLTVLRPHTSWDLPKFYLGPGETT